MESLSDVNINYSGTGSPQWDFHGVYFYIHAIKWKQEAPKITLNKGHESEPDLMWFSSAGTSGDTGGSAIQSAKGLRGLDVVVVYPRGRISPVQEKHMTTCLEDNIHVFAGKA